MTLPKGIFAYDSETDRTDPEDPETTYCCLVQICSIDAQSIDEVILYEDRYAVDAFLDDFCQTMYPCEMHCYNLGGYEFEWLRGALIRKGFTYIEMDRKRKLPPMTWRAIYDKSGLFRMDITNSFGFTLKIKDDMKLFDPAQSMESTAKSVRKDHPEWFEGLDTVKTKVRYNDGWHFYGKDREDFLYYSKLDAWSQSRITKYIVENGMNDKLSSTSTTLRDALGITYPDLEQEWTVSKRYQKDYPPLDREMQDYAESRLIGGFVWGLVGTFHGTFTKLDYKSSYPKEYAYGKLPKGKVRRISSKHPRFEEIMSNDRLVRWLRVSFDYDLKDGYLPCLNAKEGGKARLINRKMRSGHVDDWIYNENLFAEIGRHYDLSNVRILEVWYARGEVGAFERAIEHFFTIKEKSEKKSATQTYAKKAMNGGVHGKTISKTHRKTRVFDKDGEDIEGAEWMETVGDPKYCFMVGLCALENARCRLLRDCRMLIEAGYTIYMCDTDSLIVDASKEECKRILGDQMIWPESSKNKKMKDILGKLDLEAEFDTFKCWGLKRYCELKDGVCVGSAFAGMHDDLQSQILPTWETDGTMYTWTQTARRRLKREHGNVIDVFEKTAGAMNVWWKEEYEMIDRSTQKLIDNQERYGMQYNLDMWRDEYYKLTTGRETVEDMAAYLEDVQYKEVDPYWRRHIEKAYREAMKREDVYYGH